MQIHACLLALPPARPVKIVVRARGVVPRPRPPPPVAHLDPLRRDARRADRRRATCGCCSTAARTPRRRPRCSRTPRPSRRARTRSRTCASRDRRLHEQSALRGDARFRRAAGLLRVRVGAGRAGGEARGSTRSSCGCATRSAAGGASDRPGTDRGSAPVREVIERCAIPLPSGSADAPIEYPGGAGTSAAAGLARRRLRGRLQERRLQRGVRRRRRGDGDPLTAAPTARSPASTPPPSTTARACTPCSRRSSEPSSGRRGRRPPGERRVRLGRVDVGVAPDDDGRRRRAGGLPRSARGARGRGRASLTETARQPREYHHRPTSGFDEEGQGDIHVSFAFVAERRPWSRSTRSSGSCASSSSPRRRTSAVRSTRRARRARSRAAAAMGLGLALMEEVQARRGRRPQPSFTDYLIPTTLDVAADRHGVRRGARARRAVRRQGHRRAADVVATPAVVAALRARRPAATLNRAAGLPDDLVGLRRPASTAGPAPIPDVPGQQADPEYLGLGARPAGAHERKVMMATQVAIDRTALAGRDYIETLDWTVDEIDEALAVAARAEGRVQGRQAPPAAARQDAVHALPRQVHPHAQRLRVRHDPARRPRDLPRRREDAGRARREPEGHGDHPLALRPRPRDPPRPRAVRGQRLDARDREVGRHPADQPPVRRRPPDPDARRPDDAPRAPRART